MEKQKITEEMGLHKQWYEQAKEQTLETLPSFLNYLMEGFSHDYGTTCHALAAGACATAWAMNNHANGGITGFQAGAVMWEFIKGWNMSDNKCGMRLIDYDNLCYPQYIYKFQGSSISKHTFKAVQNRCREFYEKHDNYTHPDVLRHWQDIIEGNMPEGITIEP